MFFDPFRLAIALVPLAAYFAVIGLVNLRRRPFLTNGACDLAVLGVALTGVMVIGPMELFMPEAAAVRFGSFVWLFLVVFYWLCVSLVILLSRPRVVIYNIAIDQLRPVLADVVGRLDSHSRWAGDALVLSTLGIQLHLEAFSAMRCVLLVASGPHQDLQNWRRFESALAAALQQVRVPPNPRAIGLLAAALLLAIAIQIHLLSNPLAVAQAMQEMIR
ncbi:MAG: hypothetical protein JW829_07160 [Pirellulales bacterium]|nr:hypothetical protein [Pirellulales bacterium]